MKDPKPELESAHIVLRGDFNPAIFHPSWLAARELIKEDEAESAEISVITSDLAVFDVEWFSLRVTKDFFAARSNDPSRYLFLRDLVVGIFTFLEFTPQKQLGLNRDMHFKVDSETRYHDLGDSWAPKDAWKGVLIGEREKGLPGLRSITMEGNRKGSTAKYIRVKVEPSARVTPGIYIETNEHYELKTEDLPMNPLEILETAWSDAQDFAARIAKHLLKGDTA